MKEMCTITSSRRRRACTAIACPRTSAVSSTSTRRAPYSKKLSSTTWSSRKSTPWKRVGTRSSLHIGNLKVLKLKSSNLAFGGDKGANLLHEESLITVSDRVSCKTVQLIDDGFKNSKLAGFKKSVLGAHKKLAFTMRATNFFMRKKKKNAPAQSKMSLNHARQNRFLSTFVFFEVEGPVVNNLVRKLVKSIFLMTKKKNHESRFDTSSLNVEDIEKYLLVSGFLFVANKVDTDVENMRRLNKFIFHVISIAIDFLIHKFLKNSLNNPEQTNFINLQLFLKNYPWLARLKIKKQKSPPSTKINDFLTGRP